MKKRRVKVNGRILVLLLLLALIPYVACNVNYIKEGKMREEANQTIIYAGDSTNHIRGKKSDAFLVTERFPAYKTTKWGGRCTICFERTWFGTLEIEFDEPTRTDMSLAITFSEAIEQDHAWTRKDMSSCLNGYGVTFLTVDVYIPVSSKVYRVELPERPLPDPQDIEGGWSGGVIPYCYCTIEGIPDDLLISCSFYQIAVHAPFLSLSQFSSSEDELDEIYHFCKNTIESTTYAGIYVDGYRELKPYEGDAYVNEISHFSIDNNYDLAKTTLEYFADNHTWPTEWILLTISIAYEYYLYSGDGDLIKTIYPKLKKCLLQTQVDDNGLLNMSELSIFTEEEFYGLSIHDIIDWPEAERDSFSCTNSITQHDSWKVFENKYRSIVCRLAGLSFASTYHSIVAHDYYYRNARADTPNAVSNAFYYNSLNEMAFLAQELGESDDYLKYSEESRAFKKKYEQAFISSDSGLVRDTMSSTHISLHSNVAALDFGLVPEENQKTVLDFIKSKGMACSTYFSQYLLESLVKYGETEYAISLMTSKGKRGWYHMINDTGSKLTTEAWDEDIKLYMDWNHAWATSPVNVITRYMIGIRPGKPGCETVIFQPSIACLDKMDASIPVNNGTVDVSFHIEGNTLYYALKSSSTILFIPPSGAKDIIIDSALIDANRPVELQQGEHWIQHSI